MSSEDKDIFADSEEIDDPDSGKTIKDPDSMEVDHGSGDLQSENVNISNENPAIANKDDKDNDIEVDQEEESLNVLQDKSNVPDQEDNDDTDTPTKDEAAVKLFRFPQGRIKSIMKLDPEVGMVNGEAIFLVNKAVEEFIQCLAVESYHHTASSKKKTITKEHVMTAIESIDELAFLDGAMDD